MEFIFELIPGKLLAFLLAVAFIAAGVYIWRGGSAERALYDAAVGAESRTYQAEIRRKVVRSERSENYQDSGDGSVNVNYLVLGFYEKDGHFSSLDAQVDRDEYDAVKEGDTIKISFHPDNTEFVVTPMKKRPGVVWHRLGGAIFIVLGVIFILMILASLGSD
jgi:hypothetical protein